ncbi:Crp/Fnr family transcriptional regulator [Salisediminibacterium beveridgei]|uniref:Transcriptional regulator, Crp/Fnr family n=1 Tax=Salisediminibacterium beveridgei TaxID=632773 RepID=A0A1D7QWP0_9BACI|nr:Crp/Fnr family transcriptional regulator [Salisediminibacterium beveridgei]AOM83389.1 transcriptional regulator, Crp/Fnr family [Salisediminibacterium beveridgei]
MKQFLKTSLSFLDYLHPQTKNLLLTAGTEVQYETGKQLYEEGMTAETMFLIIRGQVKLSKLTADGKLFTLFLKQDGELIGEGTLLEDDVATLTAEAVTNTIVRKIPVNEIRQLFITHPDFSRHLMSWYAIQTQSSQAKFRDLMMSGKQGALYSTLIRLANSYGKETDRGIIIRTPLTHQDLATYSGSTRENINRMMSDLKDSGILTMVSGQIMIYDLEKLKQFMQCWSCPIEICTM